MFEKKLLECDLKTLTLDKAIDLARTFEATQLQLQQFSNSSRLGDRVDAIHKGNRNKSNGKFHKPSETEAKMCYFCGLPYHPRESCPAKEKNRNKCGKVGHWGKVCRNAKKDNFFRQPNPNSERGHKPNKWQGGAKKSTSGNKKGKKIDLNEVQNSENAMQLGIPTDFENLSFDTLSVNINSVSDEVFTSIRIKPYDGIALDICTNLHGKVDTGAQGNILPLRTFRKLYPKFVNAQGLPTNTTFQKLP